jgi:putative two-component system response regulator
VIEAGRPGDRILIVDDEPGNVLVLRALFEESGYREVRWTTDPTEVGALARSFRPGVILLDLHMPGKDGFEVLRELSRGTDPGDRVPVLVLTADATSESRRTALQSGARDFVTKPFDAVEVLARVRNLLDMQELHDRLRRQNELLDETVRARTAELERTVRRLEQVDGELRVAQEETIHRLSLAAEFRDDETSRHLDRMSRYCAILSARTGMAPVESELLRVASKMHDIGKLGIPDAVLLKPGPLSPGEREVMERHAEMGYRILRGSRSALVRMGALLAWTHHEKLDGSGYPRGLGGEEIPLEGRIAAIADVFDALTSDRLYRAALPVPRALAIMREGRGSHFDAELLDLFMAALDEVLAARETLADGPEAPGAQ